MAITVQNLRAVEPGVEPLSLLPGQLCFNVTDKVMFVGDGTGFKTSFGGTSVPGVAGQGWYSMPLDFATLKRFFIDNPSLYGDNPSDQQVLTWNEAVGHPIWSNGGPSGNSQVYITSNAQVVLAPGATVSEKISSAIGVSFPEESDVAIVTGVPDEVYQGLYFFTTEWIRGSSYAYPSATEVIYDNGGGPLGPTVQAAIDDLNADVIATTAVANSANSTAISALGIATAALPSTGGTMTGLIAFDANQTFPTSGISDATTTQKGVVQLNDTTSNNSTTLALTANQGRVLQEQIDAIVVSGGTTLAGGFDPNIPALDSVTLAGAAAGFVVGSDLPLPTTSNNNYYVLIVADNPSYSPPGGGGPYDVVNGDWLLSEGTTWNYLGLGARFTPASYTAAGIVQLADPLLTVQGISDNEAVTPQSLQAKVSDSFTTTCSQTIASSTAVKSAYDEANLRVPCSCFVTKGVVLSGDGVSPQPLSVGANGQVLTAFSNCATGLTWCTITSSVCGTLPITVNTSNPQLPLVGINAATALACGAVQLATNPEVCAGTSTNRAVTPSGLQSKVSDSVVTTSSTIIASSTAVKAAYDVGAAAIPRSIITGKGVVVTGTAAGTPSALPVGANGQFLTADSTQGTGLRWSTFTNTGVQSVTGVALNPLVVNNTDPQNPILSVSSGSLSALGAVQLFDSTTSTSTDFAATPNSVKTAYDVGVAAIPCSAIVGKGAIPTKNAANNAVSLPIGTDGQVLVVDSTSDTGLKWVNETSGGVIGVTGSSPIVVDNTDAQNPVVSVDAASTVAPGVVQLNDTTSSTSVIEALTASQGKILQDQINTLAVTTSLSLAGTIDASTGNMITVTSAGTLDGFVSGNPLPAPSPGNLDSFVIVVVPGTMTPPGGSSQLCDQGDWWLSTGTSWEYLNVGYDAPYASTGTPGVVQLATNAEVQSGVNVNHSVTPSGLQSKVSDSVAITSSTTLASSTAVKTAYDLALLSQDAAAVAQATANAAMPKSGGVFTGNVDFTNSSIISIDSTSTFGVDGIANFNNNINISGSGTAVTFNPGVEAIFGGNVLLGLTSSLLINGGVNYLSDSVTDVSGQFTFSVSPSFAAGVNIGPAIIVTYDNTASGLSATNVQGAIDEINNTSIPKSSFTASGELLVGSGVGTYSTLTPGSANTVLSSDGAGTLNWIPAAAGDVISVSGTSPITVDNTDPQNPIVSVNAATTTSPGISQLNDTVTSTSTTEAATARAVCEANTLASNAIPCSAYVDYGSVLVGTAIGEYTAIPTGSSGQVLSIDATCTTSGGITWTTPLTSTLCGYTCALNTALGVSAASNLSNGSGNTVVGNQAGCLLTSGIQNTLIGTQAGTSVSGATCITAVGYRAAAASSNNSSNTAIGANALECATSSGNTAVGAAAGRAINSGSNNTLVGFGTGAKLTTGGQNIGLGRDSLSNALAASFNVAVGSCSGCSITSGCCNVLVGDFAGRSIVTGGNNTIIGGYAGISALSNNVVLAAGSDIKLQVNESNALSIGPTASYGTLGQVLTSGGSGAVPTWCNPSGLTASCFPSKGSLLAGTGTGTFSALAVPVQNGCFLATCSGCATGLVWTCAVSPASFLTTGTLIVGNNALGGSFTQLNTGATSGCVLTSNSACAVGMQWASPAQVNFALVTPNNCSQGTTYPAFCIRGVTTASMLGACITYLACRPGSGAQISSRAMFWNGSAGGVVNFCTPYAGVYCTISADLGFFNYQWCNANTDLQVSWVNNVGNVCTCLRGYYSLL